MDEDLHNIDDIFKKGIDEHEEMPSGSAWENIDKNLDKKRVIFISKKYNKLKWAAAALLIFSAAMAVYTFHTNIKNKELAKESIDNKRKDIEKGVFKNDRNKIDEAPVNQTEKAATPKDTLLLHEKNKANNISPIADKVLNENEKKNIKPTEAKKAKDEIFKERPLRTLVENDEKDKLPTKEQPAEHKMNLAENGKDKQVIPKNNSSDFYTQPPKNIVTNKITTEKTIKEIDAESVSQKQIFNTEPAKISLEKVLATLNGNNRIIKEEKQNFKLKSLKAKTSHKAMFYATVFYSPDFVFNRIDNDHHDFREDDRNEIKRREKIKKAYTAGLLIGYNTGKRISIESGLTLSSMTTAIEPKQIYARPDGRGNMNYRFNCSAGYSYIPVKPGNNPDSITALSSKNILEYIAVPVAIRYNMKKGKLGFSPGFGLAINFLMKGKIETAIAGLGGAEEANIDHIEGLKSSYLNGSISLKTDYNLSRNLALTFTPAARVALTPITKDAPVKTFLNSLGVVAGLTIKL